MQMKRLFLGVGLPDNVRKEVAARVRWMGDDRRAVKAVAPVNYHVTLKFLGNVMPELEEKVCDTLDAGLKVDRITGSLGRWGVFPENGPPEVFWIGAGPAEEFQRLFTACETLLEPLGFPEETRAFHPHLTVARPAGDRKVPDEFLWKWKELQASSSVFPEFPIESVTLFESVLNGSEPVYLEVASFPAEL
jgi:RNA 2',3'-cyclic 3'-phosphodiesterase